MTPDVAAGTGQVPIRFEVVTGAFVGEDIIFIRAPVIVQVRALGLYGVLRL